VGEFAGSDGSSTASLYEFTTDGEFLQETGERTFPDGEGGGYGGLATTSTELLGPDEDGNLTVLRTLGEGDDPDVEANFKFEPESPNIGDTVTFDAGDSSPADAIQEYRWDFTGDGETDATGVTVDRVFEDAEEQTVRLTVVDADGIEASTEKSIEPENSDDRESKTEIAGTVTDSAGNQLRDIEVRAENQETDDQITTTTNSDGEYEIAVEADSEYRVFVFDQFGLEQTEFEDFVQLEEKETLKLDITLFSKFEVFEEQKLGSDRIAGLAPRIDDLSTPLINEKEDVAAEINYIEDAVDSGNIDQELADEAIERMVVGEAMVNRALEGLTDATPINLGVYDWSQGPLVFEDEMPNFDLLFQTAKGIVIGLIEASYSLKKIAKEALGEFGDLIIDRINSAIGNFIRDRLSDYQRVLETAENALSIGEMLLEIKEAADTAIERINEGATFENKRSVIKDLADPIAEQIANGLLVGAELLSIEGQLSELNTTFSADSLADDPTFTKDIETVVDETQTSLAEIGTKVQQADDAMNPESDALKELINLVRELADAGFTDIPSLLNSIWGIVRDLVSVVSSGFNIGFGIIRSRDIYTDSAGVINDITKTV
jgi:PKD repeat protein